MGRLTKMAHTVTSFSERTMDRIRYCEDVLGWKFYFRSASGPGEIDVMMVNNARGEFVDGLPATDAPPYEDYIEEVFDYYGVP